MKLKEGLKKMMKDNHVTNKELASKLGLKSDSSIGNILTRGDVKVSMFVTICDVLGYDIVIKPKTGSDKAERTWNLSDMVRAEDGRGGDFSKK